MNEEKTISLTIEEFESIENALGNDIKMMESSQSQFDKDDPKEKPYFDSFIHEIQELYDLRNKIREVIK